MTAERQLADNLSHRVNVGDSLTRTAARHPDRQKNQVWDRRAGHYGGRD